MCTRERENEKDIRMDRRTVGRTDGHKDEANVADRQTGVDGPTNGHITAVRDKQDEGKKRKFETGRTKAYLLPVRGRFSKSKTTKTRKKKMHYKNKKRQQTATICFSLFCYLILRNGRAVIIENRLTRTN